MFKGIYTIIYRFEDVTAARDWYARALGIEPYFDEPFYVGFNVRGCELGLEAVSEKVTRAHNLTAYWGVDDVDLAVKHLIECGATPNEAVRDVGDGIRTATVLDPFGNIFGVIENPHFGLRN